ncbi:MAG: SAP domain-containing protein [Acidobacteria bacterium]|nr:SAP domain-containing protein [Acidobacteriota bacterium]
MRLEEIKKIAQGFGIRPQGMKKGELIRTIQTTEQNIPCYGTERVDHCHETRCLWSGDCRREREARAGHS